MGTYDGVEFSGDISQLVVAQLATGVHRGRDDSGPGDWLDRAWHALPEADRHRLTVAIHDALSHPNPDVRSEAVRLLDGNPRQADPERLLDLVENHFELFAGLRGTADGPGTDRGEALIQLAAACASGDRGLQFRRSMARHPQYGLSVLAALAEDEPAWVAQHIDELVAPELDPNGARLTVLVYNLQRLPTQLMRAVRHLAVRQPGLVKRLQKTIRAEVDSPVLRKELRQRVREACASA